MIQSRKFLDYSDCNEQVYDVERPAPDIICPRIPAPRGANFWSGSCKERLNLRNSGCLSECPMRPAVKA